MGTQWRVGMGGAYGLDYSALPPVLEMMGVPRTDWAEILESIRVCEESALETMRGKRK